MTRLYAFWERIRGTYWVVPSAMAAASIAISFLMIELDRRLTPQLTDLTWVYSGGPEGARAMLSTIAASMITVAGVTFSITIVALTLASQQFGPRLLRNFLRDLGNQVTLGTFIATFLYCLLILRTVRGNDDAQFVPHLAVTVGVVLAMLSIGVLIFFIHHVAISIQATQVIANVAADLDAAIARLFPETLEQGRGAGVSLVATAVPSFDDADVVVATRAGYVQAVDTAQVVHLARGRNVIVRIDAVPGSFVRVGSKLMSIAAVSPGPADDFNERLAAAFIIGAERSGTQDVAYFFNQLVELAVRALSPGINDPATACACIDRLQAALCGLAGRRTPSAFRFDEDQRLRVIAQPATFPVLLDVAFTEIARYGRASVSVSCRLLEALRDLASVVRDEAQRQAVRSEAGFVADGMCASASAAADRLTLAAHYAAAVAALQHSRDREDAEAS